MTAPPRYDADPICGSASTNLVKILNIVIKWKFEVETRKACGFVWPKTILCVK